MKRLNSIFLSAAIVATSIPAFASTPLHFKGDHAATVGILVRDIKTGKDVVSFNSEKSISPASTMKLVTTASALSLIGEDFRYTTVAYANGAVDKNGTLNGNVIINPSGDPTLYSSYFEEGQTFIDDIVSALKTKGIKTIAGEIIVNDGWMPEQGQVSTWEIEDACYSYGAGYFAMNFSDNIFRLNTESGLSTPFIPGLDAVIEKNDSSYTMLAHGINSPLYMISGPKVDQPTTKFWLPMFDPANAFVNQLTAKIEENGIAITESSANVINDSIPLCEYKSPALKEIMQSLMFRSDNMMAESMQRLLAPGHTQEIAIDRELEFLKSKGIDCDYITIRDGSGLTRSNSLQPKFLADVLEMMMKGENKDTFLSFFPRAGKDGTMKSFLANTPLQGRLAMKTGSMSEVRCYAGYLLDSLNEPTHVVVVMVNRYKCGTSNLRKAIENYLLKTLK